MSKNDGNSIRKNKMEAINLKRRFEKAQMEALGIKSKKAYRRWQKQKRRELKKQRVAK
jgi:hypothetical protein